MAVRLGLRAVRRFGGGLLQDEYTDTLDRRDMTALDASARQLGVTVSFAGEINHGLAEGQITGRAITLQRDAESPLRQLYGHEISHRIRDLAPKEFDRFVQAVKEADPDFSGKVAEMLALGRRADEQYSEASAIEDVAADYAGMLMERPQTLETFIAKNQHNPTLLQRLGQIFRELAQRLKGKLTGQQRTQAENAAAALEKAYAAAVKAERKKSAENEGVRYSIKRTSQMTLEQQLKDYYAGKLKSSDSLYFGITPDALSAAELDDLPLAFGTADFKKSVKDKHNVPRRAIKKVQENLENALFAFSDGARIGVVVPDIDADGKPLLIGIEKGVQMDAEKVNAIRIMYGLDHPAEWIRNQIESGKTAIILDEEKANAFLYPYGYLASRKEGIRSMDGSISSLKQNVKPKYSLKRDAALEKDFASIREQLEAGELTEEQADRLRGEAVDRLLARQAEEYGRMQPGETPAREITLPRRTDGKTKVSRTVRTILEGKATPELALPGIKQLVAEGAFS